MKIPILSWTWPGVSTGDFLENEMDFRDQLNASMTPEVQRDLVKLVRYEYEHTHLELKRRYKRQEAKDVEPHVRRANIESALLELHERYPGVRVTSGTTSRGQSFRYLVVGQFLVTQSYVEADRRLPREAVFRSGFAVNPNQYRLFPEEEIERVRAVQDRDLSYIIITHTPSAINLAEPSHVTAVLVDKHCRYITSIELMENLRKITESNSGIEQVEDLRQVRLRNKAKRKQTGS